LDANACLEYSLFENSLHEAIHLQRSGNIRWDAFVRSTDVMTVGYYVNFVKTYVLYRRT